MDRPVQAATYNEILYYLQVTPCQACGRGPLEPESRPEIAPGRSVTMQAVCRHCHDHRSIELCCRHEAPAGGPDPEIINPTDEPSRIIDLAQWLSLFHSLIGIASIQSDHVHTRRIGYQAALCLTEALKFYGPDETPPESAFFAPGSEAVFRKFPKKFAKSKLRDTKARLPRMERMADRIRRDETDRPPRRWWRFWRR